MSTVSVLFFTVHVCGDIEDAGIQGVYASAEAAIAAKVEAERPLDCPEDCNCNSCSEGAEYHYYIKNDVEVG